jgi:hypothetical protein
MIDDDELVGALLDLYLRSSLVEPLTAENIRLHEALKESAKSWALKGESNDL